MKRKATGDDDGINSVIRVHPRASVVIIQTPFAPFVHPKLNSGKEFPSVPFAGAPRPPLPFVNIVSANNQRDNGFAVEVKQQAQITLNFNGVNRAPVVR